MYRWLLCFRYLRTRYIALASIISVMLGVATLIVVNSVMEGFSAEMHKRIHGILSDVVIDCHSADGLLDPDEHLKQIRNLLGDDLIGATTVVHVPAMLGIRYNGQLVTRQINLVGIDERSYAKVSDFSEYLLHPENRQQLHFELLERGYGAGRPNFPESGWPYRRTRAAYDKALADERARAAAFQPIDEPVDATAATLLQLAEPATSSQAMTVSDADRATSAADGPSLPGLGHIGADATAAREFDPATEQFCGIVLGITTCSVRGRDPVSGEPVDYFYARPGDDVQVMFPTAGEQPKVINQLFTVVDFYESKMSEYDSTFAFVPLSKLQEYRGMVDPQSLARSVSSIQLKLRPGADLALARDRLRAIFPPHRYPYHVQTWRDMQGPLLQAVRLETTLLNILLFLIIAVAVFGILATFFMIVVEKTRDIGILKSLGASSWGVMSIFLNYGLLLGIVGSGVGLIGGLLFVRYINDIAALLERITGTEVFDPTVYYFEQIPTITNPATVVWVVLGSIGIAVLASVLPALRAARLQPVQALRYE